MFNRPADFTLTNGRIDKHRNRDLVNQHGSNWVASTTRAREVVDKFSSRPARGQQSYKWQLLCKCSQAADLGQKGTENLCPCHQAGPVPGETVNVLPVSFTCKLSCKSCTCCLKAATKERCKSGYCKTSLIKKCEQCFLCRSIVLCKTCTKCDKFCTKSACRGQTKPVLGNLGSLGGRTQSGTNVETGLHPTFPNLTRSPQSSAAMYILAGTSTCWRHCISWQTKMQ